MSYRYPFERPTATNTDDDIDEIDFLFQNSSMNLFGRSFKETLADFPKIGSRQKRDDHATPSLTSDDTPSPSPSSYGLATPSPIRSDYTASPPSSPIRSRATRRTLSFSENVVARPSYDLPPIRREDSVMRTFGPNPYKSRTTSVERQPTPFRESKLVIDIHDPIEEEDEEEEKDGSYDDDYKPKRPALAPSKPVGRKRVPKQTGEFECNQCPKTFTRSFDRKRHVESIHGKPSESDILLRTCSFCGSVCSRPDACKRHVDHCPKNPDAKPEATSKAQEQHAVKMKKAGKPRPKATIGKAFRGSHEVRC